MQHFIHFVASLVLTLYISVRSFQNFSLFYHFFLKNILMIRSKIPRCSDNFEISNKCFIADRKSFYCRLCGGVANKP